MSNNLSFDDTSNTLTTANLVATGANLGTVANLHIAGGTNGQVLTTDGANNLSWTTKAGGYAIFNANAQVISSGFDNYISNWTLSGTNTSGLTCENSAGGAVFSNYNSFPITLLIQLQGLWSGSATGSRVQWLQPNVIGPTSNRVMMVYGPSDANGCVQNSSCVIQMYGKPGPLADPDTFYIKVYQDSGANLTWGGAGLGLPSGQSSRLIVTRLA